MAEHPRGVRIDRELRELARRPHLPEAAGISRTPALSKEGATKQPA